MKGSFYDKNGLNEVNLEYNEKYKAWIRPNTSDKEMLKECLGTKSDYKTLDCKDKVCLDLGANIGGFVILAAKAGAKQIISYEPEPFNFEMLTINSELLKMFDVNLIKHKAAIGKTNGSFNLIVNPGFGSACSASLNLKPNKNRIKIPVNVHCFKDVLELYKPDIVKMDIEGAEYDILDELDNAPYVKNLAIELHGGNNLSEIKMHDTWEKLSQNWNVIDHQEKFTFGKVRLMTAHLSR